MGPRPPGAWSSVEATGSPWRTKLQWRQVPRGTRTLLRPVTITCELTRFEHQPQSSGAPEPPSLLTFHVWGVPRLTLSVCNLLDKLIDFPQSCRHGYHYVYYWEKLQMKFSSGETHGQSPAGSLGEASGHLRQCSPRRHCLSRQWCVRVCADCCHLGLTAGSRYPELLWPSHGDLVVADTRGWSVSSRPGGGADSDPQPPGKQTPRHGCARAPSRPRSPGRRPDLCAKSNALLHLLGLFREI